VNGWQLLYQFLADEKIMNSLRKNLIIMLASIVLLLCSLEGFARIILNVQPVIERFQLNPQLGWEWTPGYDAIETYHGENYRMQISSQSLRNEEVAVPKPADVFRIIAVGDSIIEGPGVELEHTFVKLLEQSLQTQVSQTVEVINAGTGDYGTEQEFIWLHNRGLIYEPNLVILGVFLNDSRSFDAPPVLVTYLNNFLLKNSAFYFFYHSMIRDQMVSEAKQDLDFRFRYLEIEAWESGAWRDDPETLSQIIQAADQDWGLAWDEDALIGIENQLTNIHQLLEANNIPLLLLVFPVKVQVYAEVDTSLGLDYPQQYLVAFAEAHDIPILDLLPVLHKYKSGDLFFDHAHLKPETHKIVADVLLQTLLDENLIPQSP
jgi:hypothetical protein